ncbi:hypothetical protein [Streptomyces sp. enrichment culture]|uniref:hypothetical protein n=1 Tax=Streptomyces sp. enrichment culture TaxID=1795815 RepID=UPI003F560E7D
MQVFAWAVAMLQPSPREGTNSWRMHSVAGCAPCRPAVCAQASNAALGTSSARPSAASVSSSVPAPGMMRRSTLSIIRSPKATDVLDCSPVSGLAGSPAGITAPGTWWYSSAPQGLASTKR